MTKSEQLLQLLRHPHEIQAEQVYDLHGLLKRYPYFQIGYALLAKAAHMQNPDTAGQAIQLAAIHATDRGHFKALLENRPPFAVTHTQQQLKPVLKKAPSATKKDAARHTHFINEYIDMLQQKHARPITNPKSLEQQRLIQRFVQQETPFKPQALQASLHKATSEVDFTQKSTTFNDSLATESLAKILVQQGKTQRALEIYDQLALKFPDKRAYFAALIQELKSQH